MMLDLDHLEQYRRSLLTISLAQIFTELARRSAIEEAKEEQWVRFAVPPDRWDCGG